MSLFSLHGLAHLTQSYGPWLLGVVVMLEAMGLPLPAESLLIATAAFAGSSHHLAVAWIVIPAAAGAIVGDNLGYLIGRSLGWRVLRRWGRHIGLTDDRLTLGAYLFRCHGGKVVFFGRFVAVLRTLAALLAGANRMNWWWFLPCNAAGGILWSCVYGLGAYWLGKEVERVARPAGFAIGLLAAAVIVTVFLLIRRHEQELTARAKREMRGA
ncbi:MAG TPA: DedA family protein [Acetobacteraceae bacterium]|nr:DedA family protein [Acetobacteraceae bacterium]